VQKMYVLRSLFSWLNTNSLTGEEKQSLRSLHKRLVEKDDSDSRILCSLVRVIILKNEGAPREVIDSEWKEFRRRLR
jgi:hypothetical protein